VWSVIPSTRTEKRCRRPPDFYSHSSSALHWPPPPQTPLPRAPPPTPGFPQLLTPTPLPSALLPPAPLASTPRPQSSFSFPAAFLLSACSSSIRPVTGRWRTASGPQMVSNPLWKPHSTAASTGLSKMKGRNGTAARPNYSHESVIAQSILR